MQYLRPNNFGKGDIRRMSTVGTPYLGSPWANWCQDYFTPSNLELIFGRIGGHGDANCFPDLSVDHLGFDGAGITPSVPYQRNWLTAMLAPVHAPVAWHPMVGQAGNQPFGMIAGKSLAGIFGAVFPFIEDPSLLGLTSSNSDWIVMENSQLDGNWVQGVILGDGTQTIIPNVVHANSEMQDGTVARNICHALDLTFTSKPGDDPKDQDTSSGISYFAGSN